MNKARLRAYRKKWRAKHKGYAKKTYDRDFKETVKVAGHRLTYKRGVE